MNKTCISCYQTKELSCFPIVRQQKGNFSQEGYSSKCDVCRAKMLQTQKEWRLKNKERIKSNYLENKESILQKCKEYREVNKEKIKLLKHDYYQKEENKKRRNEKDKNRKKDDYTFKLMANIRTRIHNVLKQNKNDFSDKLLGCSKSQLIKWLEYQFNSDYNWENYGTVWHIDHVIPLSFFDLQSARNQYIAFNWTNLRPLHAHLNLSKNDSIVKNDIEKHMITLSSFLTLNNGYETSMETCWWRRVELRYRNNPQVEESFIDFLKGTIRIEDPKPSEAPKKYKAKLKTG